MAEQNYQINLEESTNIQAHQEANELSSIVLRHATPIFVNENFCASEAIKVFHTVKRHPEELLVSTKALGDNHNPAKIKSGDVFLFDTKCGKFNEPYWRNDGFQWEDKGQKTFPKSEPKYRQVTWWLKHKNVPTNEFIRREFYDMRGRSDNVPLWDSSRCIVSYKGTCDLTKNVKSVHGNKKFLLNTAVKRKPLFDNLQACSDDDDFDLSKSKKVRLSHAASQQKQVDGSVLLQSSELASPVENETLQAKSHKSTGPFFESTHRMILTSKKEKAVMEKQKPAKFYREWNIEAASNEMNGDTGNGPRNKTQVSNIYRSIKSMKVAHDDFHDVLCFALNYPDLILKVDAHPGIVVVMNHPMLMQHVGEFVKMADITEFFYDTTFNVGPIFTSILTLRHTALLRHPISDQLKHPVFPIAYMFHTYQTSHSSHTPFFEALKHEYAWLNSSKVCIITDREKSIRNAILSILPNVKHLYCWNHIIQNVKFFTKEKFPGRESKLYSKSIKRLLWTKTEEEFFKTILMYKGNSTEAINFEDDDVTDELDDEEKEVTDNFVWDEAFKKYFEKNLQADLLKIHRGEVQQYGFLNSKSGITNNISESSNAMTKSTISAMTNKSMYCTIYEVYTMMTTNLLDIKKAIASKDGEFRLNDTFFKKGQRFSSISVDESLQLLQRHTTSRPSVQWNPQSNFSEKEKLAQEISDNKAVSLLGDGVFDVKDLMGRHFQVDLKTKKCYCKGVNCVHLLAVCKALKFKCLLDPKSVASFTQLLNNFKPKRVGKKGKPIKVPPKYLPSILSPPKQKPMEDVQHSNGIVRALFDKREATSTATSSVPTSSSISRVRKTKPSPCLYSEWDYSDNAAANPPTIMLPMETGLAASNAPVTPPKTVIKVIYTNVDSSARLQTKPIVNFESPESGQPSFPVNEVSSNATNGKGKNLSDRATHGAPTKIEREVTSLVDHLHTQAPTVGFQPLANMPQRTNKSQCACKKPQGSRFMICCDRCDQWYHGSCAKITKIEAQKLEKEQTTWLCLSCALKE